MSVTLPSYIRNYRLAHGVNTDAVKRVLKHKLRTKIPAKVDGRKVGEMLHFNPNVVSVRGKYFYKFR